MKFGRSYNRILVVVTIALTFIACRPDTVCHETMTVRLTCEFRELYTDQNNQPQTRIVWDSLTVKGIGTDSILYNNSKSVSKIMLPMRQNTDSTCYALTYHGQTDTLLTYHDNTQSFVSLECGCVCTYQMRHIRHTRHWLDSLIIENKEINRNSGTNIYFVTHSDK